MIDTLNLRLEAHWMRAVEAVVKIANHDATMRRYQRSGKEVLHLVKVYLGAHCMEACRGHRMYLKRVYSGVFSGHAMNARIKRSLDREK